MNANQTKILPLIGIETSGLMDHFSLTVDYNRFGSTRVASLAHWVVTTRMRAIRIAPAIQVIQSPYNRLRTVLNLA